jgi:hypothetical protein
VYDNGRIAAREQGSAETGKTGHKERIDMAKESQHLCKWEKGDIKERFDKLKALVVPPAFICRKCGRVANRSDLLCKPETL